jgi:CBS domain-containing protein
LNEEIMIYSSLLLFCSLLGGVPVVDDDGKVLGVISEYDLLVRLGRHKETQDDGRGWCTTLP